MNVLIFCISKKQKQTKYPLVLVTLGHMLIELIPRGLSLRHVLLFHFSNVHTPSMPNDAIGASGHTCNTSTREAEAGTREFRVLLCYVVRSVPVEALGNPF